MYISAFGNFVSGKGRYSILFFDDISGKFRTAHDDINFYDVKINLSGYKISTDALSIKDKKLEFSPINLTDKNGKLISTFTR